MKPINPAFNGRPVCNTLYKGPADLLTSTGVGCGDLPALSEVGELTTFWKPTEEEIMALRLGQVIMITVFGAQVPMLVDVTKKIDVK